MHKILMDWVFPIACGLFGLLSFKLLFGSSACIVFFVYKKSKYGSTASYHICRCTSTKNANSIWPRIHLYICRHLAAIEELRSYEISSNAISQLWYVRMLDVDRSIVLTLFWWNISLIKQILRFIFVRKLPGIF